MASTQPAATAKSSNPSDHEHELGESGIHHHDAPHGGVLLGLGGEFAHIEFVLESASGELTAYVLDSSAANGVRIAAAEMPLEIHAVHAAAGRREVAAKIGLAAQESALSGEKPGDSSTFKAAHEALRGADGFDATLGPIEIRGRTFRDVRFTYERHGG